LLVSEGDLLVMFVSEGVIKAATAGRVRARIVVDGVEGPTTPQADAILAAQRWLVVPDILANAGGAVPSYFEWVQTTQAHWWSPDEVEQRLAERMSVAWRRGTEHATRRALSLRDSASSLSVQTVAAAHRIRGLCP